MPWASSAIELIRTAAEMDEVLDDVLGSRLADRRFEPVGGRSWVRSEKGPVREVVEVLSLKGYGYVPSWAISFDFVPHVTRSGTVAWHRTAKGHGADLRIDPLDDPDQAGQDRLRFSRYGRPAPLRRDLVRSAKATIARSDVWFGHITDVDSTVPLFEEAQRQRVVRFGFDNHVQHRLAFAFVLAHVGEPDRARAQLDQWCAIHLASPGWLPERKHEAVRSRLGDLLEAAGAP